MPRLVYLACAADRLILLFLQDPATGALTRAGEFALPGAAPAPEVPGSLPLALHPNRRLLYAADRAPPYHLHSFAIDHRTGGLTPLAVTPLPHSMAYVATDQAGRWLLAASYPGALVSLSPIAADGTVREPPRQVITTPPRAHCIRPDPANKFVHAASLGGDVILTWPLTEAGLDIEAVRATPVHPGAGPRHLAFNRTGTRLYVLNERDASIEVFARTPASGALVPLQALKLPDAPQAGAAAAADLHLHPAGHVLYASERRTSTISLFAVAADGTLAPSGSVPCVQEPRAFALTPDGCCLFVAGLAANAMGVYRIDAPSGALTALARHATAGRPSWIEIVDPNPE